MAQCRMLGLLVEASLMIGALGFGACAQPGAPRQEERPLFLPDVSPSPLNPISRDRGNAAVRTAQLACVGHAMKAFENFMGPAEAREYAEGAFFMWCVLKTMPPDWTDGAVIQRHADELAVRARRIDASIDPCLLVACTVGAK